MCPTNYVVQDQPTKAYNKPRIGLRQVIGLQLANVDTKRYGRQIVGQLQANKWMQAYPRLIVGFCRLILDKQICRVHSQFSFLLIFICTRVKHDSNYTKIAHNMQLNACVKMHYYIYRVGCIGLFKKFKYVKKKYTVDF